MAPTETNSNAPYLPSEIVEMICRIAYPHAAGSHFPEDMQGLKQFRLVNKLFADVGAKVMFPRVRFDISKDFSKVLDLAVSRLAGCPGCLQIFIPPILTSDPSSAPPTSLRSLAPLHALSNVKSVEVSFVHRGDHVAEIRNRVEMQHWMREIKVLIRHLPNLDRIWTSAWGWAHHFAHRIIDKLPQSVVKLQIHCNGKNNPSLLGPPGANNTINLRDLTVGGPLNPENDNHSFNTFATTADLGSHTAPHLRSLMLTCMGVERADKATPFLRNAKNLRSFELNNIILWSYETWEELFKSLSEHERLTDINIYALRVKEKSLPVELISHFSLPALKSLALTTIRLPIEHLCGLIFGSKDTVEKIELENVKLNANGVNSWLPVFDALLECICLRNISLHHLQTDGHSKKSKDEWFDCEVHWHQVVESHSLERPLDLGSQKDLYKFAVLTASSRDVEHKIGELMRMLFSRNTDCCVRGNFGRATVLACLAGYYMSLHALANIKAGRAEWDDIYPWEEAVGLRAEQLFGEEVAET